MVETRSGAGHHSPAVGEKHDIQSPKEVTPEHKRAKTSKTGERQAKLEDTFSASEQKGEEQGEDTAMEDEPQDQPEEYDPEFTSPGGGKPSHSKGSAVRQQQNGDTVPSSILEKGIIYFFMRGRVNVEDPSKVDEVARSHFVLRPIPKDAKLGDGPIGDAGNARLCLIPKKVLPGKSGRLVSFVEKGGLSFKILRETFLEGKEYDTKTAGHRHMPAATPVGEGVYAITTTGRESHLVYMLTIPSDLGEVQKGLGLQKQGSFIISTKNPKFPGPPYARLPKGPEYPKNITEEFGDLRWIPTRPEHLDYANSQILLIGEKSGIEKATEPQKDDVEEGKDEPAEVLEELEEEDTARMEHLSSSDSKAVYADLEANAKDYPKLQTTWDTS